MTENTPHRRPAEHDVGLIPPPAHLSNEAQQILRRPRFDGPSPALTDAVAWRAQARNGNAGMRDLLRGSGGGVTLNERLVGDVPVWIAQPAAPMADAIILDVHGGGLILGGGDVTGLIGARSARGTGYTHWAVDYRMPPDHPFPAPVDDVLTVYRHLLMQKSPARIAVMGGSAGGNLATAMLIRARDDGLPMPAALVLEAPEVDLSESGDTFQTLIQASNTLGSLLPLNRLYAAGIDLNDPRVSPLFADLHGLPPTLLWVGTRDMFLSNTVRMHRKLLASGVTAELHVWEAMPHGGFPGSAEQLDVEAQVSQFLRAHLASDESLA